MFRYSVWRSKCLYPKPHIYWVRRTSSSTHTRIKRFINRLPKSLRPYVVDLQAAPVSHIASFLILHEITAVIPLLGLGLGFHYSGWLPYSWIEGEWVIDGLKKFSGYFGRKGWFGFKRSNKESNCVNDIDIQNSLSDYDEGIKADFKIIEEKWVMNEHGTRILLEVATAYAITKLLLPARIFFSVWSTPWFARVVIGGLRRVFSKTKVLHKSDTKPKL